jgi:3-oxoacyl-[acyl-carrier-protein] synthase-3
MSSPDLALTEQLLVKKGTDPFVTCGIAGIGAALPAGTVDTAAIAARVGVEPEWIVRRTGIERRHRLGEGERVSDLALGAGREALADAGVDAADLDAVIVATSSADEIMPHAAPLVAHALGARNAMAWDTGLACTGFLAALEQAAALIESGRAGAVLAIAVEGLSRYTDHDDRKTAALFGDGAGAAVLTGGGRMRLAQSMLRADADDADALVISPADPLVRMDGPLVFQRAVAGMERCCREVLAEAALTPADIDLVIPHQANARITTALRERLGLPADRIVDTIGHHGNTGAASIPLALADAYGEGRLPETGRILLTAFGAGFAFGAQLIEIGDRA